MMIKVMEEFNDRIYEDGITWLFGHHCLECGHLTFAQYEVKELAKYFYEVGQGKYKEESSSEPTTLNYKGSIDTLDNAVAEEGNVYNIGGEYFAFLKGKWRKNEEYYLPFTNWRGAYFNVED